MVYISGNMFVFIVVENGGRTVSHQKNKDYIEWLFHKSIGLVNLEVF